MKTMYNKKSNTVFAEDIGSITKVILDKFQKQTPYASIFADWKAVVGEKFASKSAPYKIITQGDKKILVLKSKKGCSVDLQHCSLQILEKIHKFLGKKIFSFIKIVQLDVNDSI